MPSGDRVSFCRAVATDPRHPRLSCTPFYPGSGRWGYDRISGSHATAGPVEGTWLATVLGARPLRRRAAGHHRLPGARLVGLAVRRGSAPAPGAVVDQAFLPSADGGVSWCRTLGTRDGVPRRLRAPREQAAPLGSRPALRAHHRARSREPHLARHRRRPGALQPRRCARAAARRLPRPHRATAGPGPARAPRRGATPATAPSSAAVPTCRGAGPWAAPGSRATASTRPRWRGVPG